MRFPLILIILGLLVGCSSEQPPAAPENTDGWQASMDPAKWDRSPLYQNLRLQAECDVPFLDEGDPYGFSVPEITTEPCVGEGAPPANCTLYWCLEKTDWLGWRTIRCIALQDGCPDYFRTYNIYNQLAPCWESWTTDNLLWQHPCN